MMVGRKDVTGSLLPRPGEQTWHTAAEALGTALDCGLDMIVKFRSSMQFTKVELLHNARRDRPIPNPGSASGMNAAGLTSDSSRSAHDSNFSTIWTLESSPKPRQFRAKPAFSSQSQAFFIMLNCAKSMLNMHPASPKSIFKEI